METKNWRRKEKEKILPRTIFYNLRSLVGGAIPEGRGDTYAPPLIFVWGGGIVPRKIIANTD